MAPRRFANYAAQAFDRSDQPDRDTRQARQAPTSTWRWARSGWPRSRRCPPTASPRPSARHNNVVSFKSIYLDIDVGKAGAYATTDDAFAALDDFCHKVGLPEPTDGGAVRLRRAACLLVHKRTRCRSRTGCRWPRALRDAALAYGLKFDPQVTVNPAGILRVPNTFNHKKHAAVQGQADGGTTTFQRYGYQQLVQALSQLHRTTAGVKQGPAQTTNAPRTSPPTSARQRRRCRSTTSPSTARRSTTSLDARRRRRRRAAVEPGALLASFTDDPIDAAHRLSEGDPRYTKADTDKKLLEKINARAANPDAGWPHCTVVQRAAPGLRHLPAVRPEEDTVPPSPDAAPPAPTAPPAVHAGQQRPADAVRLLAQQGQPRLHHALPTRRAMPLYRRRAQLPDPRRRHRHGRRAAGLPDAIIGGVEKCGATSTSAPTCSRQPRRQRTGQAPGRLRRYQQLQDSEGFSRELDERTCRPSSAPSHQSTYGWTDDGTGFTFDETIYTAPARTWCSAASTTTPTSSVTGELKPWQDAMKLVYGNTPLETVVASAFAAPLVELVGSTSLVLSVYSQLSGIGKTTVDDAGAGGVGRPALRHVDARRHHQLGDEEDRRPEDRCRSTGTSCAPRTSSRRSSTSSSRSRRARRKSRLNKDITQAEAPSFTTMFVVASNYGISDTVYSQTDGTEAGGLRVFEIEAEAAEQLRCTDYDARQLLATYRANYGVAGATYAEFIARNKATGDQHAAGGQPGSRPPPPASSPRSASGR